MRQIEKDSFDFEFLSRLAERESWRKEIHRPIYHVHKWWAKRLGSVFRGILLGATTDDQDLAKAFYEVQSIPLVVLDPFMGSGTTIGEAHKLGFAALGRDINPVAVQAVKVGLGPLNKLSLQKALVTLLDDVGAKIQQLYKSRDSKGNECDVLYFFWVMQTNCLGCKAAVDLFPSYVVASNAYPERKPEVHVVCPECGHIFHAANKKDRATCGACEYSFLPDVGSAKGAKATCRQCLTTFPIANSMSRDVRPRFRLYGKLVLTREGDKEYLGCTHDDYAAFERCSQILRQEEQAAEITLPTLKLEHGYNTRQALGYGFTAWRDFFNDRQLLALGWLRSAIERLEDIPTRDAMGVLFSGVLEFNNLFASYKGEGTGAVRHMFSHHVLKPERVPIEANVWGTLKSSGSFTGLFKGRLLRALQYREAPKEVGSFNTGGVSSPPFSGQISDHWPTDGRYDARQIYLSCGDSASTGLESESVDLIVTDPPFFDNVHYSELADFFYAWHQQPGIQKSTRQASEVQDTDAIEFAEKLRRVFAECHRVLKADGLLVFTYHHSRADGWRSVAKAILGAGFLVTNSQPVKAEMSVAAPKNQAKEPIQLDIVLVCKKSDQPQSRCGYAVAIERARTKAQRLERAGFVLSRNDRKVILFGQLLAEIRVDEEVDGLEAMVAGESLETHQTVRAVQLPA